MLRSLGGGQIKKINTRMAAANLKAVQIIIKNNKIIIKRQKPKAKMKLEFF